MMRLLRTLVVLCIAAGAAWTGYFVWQRTAGRPSLPAIKDPVAHAILTEAFCEENLPKYGIHIFQYPLPHQGLLFRYSQCHSDNSSGCADFLVETNLSYVEYAVEEKVFRTTRPDQGAVSCNEGASTELARCPNVELVSASEARYELQFYNKYLRTIDDYTLYEQGYSIIDHDTSDVVAVSRALFLRLTANTDGFGKMPVCRNAVSPEPTTLVRIAFGPEPNREPLSPKE